MNFQDFCDVVKRDVWQYLPLKYQSAEVEIQHPEKVNVGERTGVSFRVQWSKMAPIVYLNDFYSQLQLGNKTMGATLEAIANQAAHGIDEVLSEKFKAIEPEKIESWENVKDRIYITAIGRTRNESLLQSLPHEDMGDFSCVYRLNPFEPSGENGSVLISNNMLNQYGVSEQELHDKAVENTMRDNPPVLARVSDAMEIMHDPMLGIGTPEMKHEKGDQCNLLRNSGPVHARPDASAVYEPGRREEERNWWEKAPSEETESETRSTAEEEEKDSGDHDTFVFETEDPDQDNSEAYQDDDLPEFDEDEVSRAMDIPLFILTNREMSRGAGVVFLPGVLDAIQKKMPEGFYVLPSSIHECMIISKNAAGPQREMDEMVSTINASQVLPEEQLSDFAHTYDAGRKLLVCPGAPQLNKEKTVEQTQMLESNPIL